MIGRGAQGRPWFPGQLARYLATGRRPAEPSIEAQLQTLSALYEDILLHYGLRVGVRHARKHLAWGLNVAAAAMCAPAQTLKAWRERVLTAERPTDVLQRLSEAFSAFSWKAAA